MGWNPWRVWCEAGPVVKILLTGASSFTGFAFATALAAAGHELVAPLRGAAGSYNNGVRAQRVARLAGVARIVWDCPFGGPAFLALADEGFDLLCHHAAQVGDYRSPEFDVAAALAANTRALPQILRAMPGLRGMILTGSVFAQNEGAGTAPREAFSPYGLSKGLTAELVAYHCRAAGVALGKFVIANPFGPFEEPRFCHHLVQSWRQGATPLVRTPFYVRDNIPIDLLAALYVGMCEQMGTAPADRRLAPSLYAETQGAFATRFADEIARRWGGACPLELAAAQEFTEPAVRINTDPARQLLPHWDETASWDRLAAYYDNAL